MKRFLLMALLAGLIALGVSPRRIQLLAQEEPAANKQQEPEPEVKPTETITAQSKPLTVYESFNGVFESTRTHEVKTDFKVWTDLKVESILDEGTIVSAAQQLLKLDTESIDKAVTEAEFAARTAEFDLETAKLAKQEINETFELDRKMAEEAWKHSQEDFEYYQRIQLPMRLKDFDYDEKSAGYFLEYAKDELDQLEKMYTEDQLTEESEEIVLKRARRSVESAERSREQSLIRVQRARETDLPREKVQKEQSLKRDEMTYSKSMITLPIQKQKTEIALAQAEFALANKQKNLAELQSDQQKMIITSPAEGMLYYGRCERGKWLGPAGSAARRLETDKKLAANTVIMTVVDINQMMIRANLEETELDSLAVGMRGKALVKAAGNKVLSVRVKSVGRIPLDDGKFDCQIVVDNLPTDASIMPGMSCKLSFVAYENKQSVCVPKASVFSDDEEVTHYVYLMQDGQPKRKSVQVGRVSGDDIEILEGLTAGEKIAKAKP